MSVSDDGGDSDDMDSNSNTLPDFLLYKSTVRVGHADAHTDSAVASWAGVRVTATVTNKDTLFPKF